MPPPIINLDTSSDVRFRDIVGRDQYQVAKTGNLVRKVFQHVSGNVANVSVVEVVSVDAGNNAQFDLLLSTPTTPLVLANITAADIATWSGNNSILSLRQGTTTFRSANVAVGNLVASGFSGTIPSLTLVSNGVAKLDNCLIRSFQKTLGATVGNGSEICILSNTNEAFTAELTVAQIISATVSIVKTYQFTVRNNATANAWHRLVPLTSSPSSEWGVEIRVGTTTTTLRLVRLSGSTTTNLACTLTLYQSRADPVTISPSATSTTDITFASTLYETTCLTQVGGNVGIGTDNPTSRLTVAGRAYVDTLVATNGVVAGTVSGRGKFLDSTPIWQGAYMSWNHSGGDGYTDFMCKRGFGPGGYQFYLSANNATTFADGKTTLAILDENGITMTQGIYSAPGSIVGSMLATGRGSGLSESITISPTSLNRTTYTTWQTIATINYTPKSTSSRLSMHFDIDYLLGGNAADSIFSRILVDNITKIWKQQLFGNQTFGTGTRSNTIFPLSATVNNTALTSRSIQIQVYVGATDDTLSFLTLPDPNWTFELLETQT